MKKQRGMTLIGWVVVLGLIAFFATLTMRVAPMYQEYYGVVQIMNDMEQELKDNKYTKQQVMNLLKRRFNTGYITSVKDENIEISHGKKVRHMTKIVIDYEIREPFIAQINILGHFHKEIDVEPKPSKF